MQNTAKTRRPIVLRSEDPAPKIVPNSRQWMLRMVHGCGIVVMARPEPKLRPEFYSTVARVHPALVAQMKAHPEATMNRLLAYKDPDMDDLADEAFEQAFC